MVGNWLRNFGFADQVFGRLLREDSELEVHVVASRDNLKVFRSHDRLHLHCGISDEELLLRYRSASLLFLPLDGFVANNAVFETAAVGCPLVIASDQVGSQFPTTVMECKPLNEDIAVRRIRELLDEPDQFGGLRRDWVVQRYDWRKIGAETSMVLKGNDGSFSVVMNAQRNMADDNL